MRRRRATRRGAAAWGAVWVGGRRDASVRGEARGSARSLGRERSATRGEQQAHGGAEHREHHEAGEQPAGGPGLEGDVDEDALHAGGRGEAGGLHEGRQQLRLEGARVAVEGLGARDALLPGAHAGNEHDVAQGHGAFGSAVQRDEQGLGRGVLPGQRAIGDGELGHRVRVAEVAGDDHGAAEIGGNGVGAQVEVRGGLELGGELRRGEAGEHGEHGAEQHEATGTRAREGEDHAAHEGQGRADPGGPGHVMQHDAQQDGQEDDRDRAQAQHGPSVARTAATMAGPTYGASRAQGREASRRTPRPCYREGVRRDRRARAPWAGAAVLLGLAGACGGGELATRWVPADAAVVRCTTAGRDRMPPILLDLPVPPVPTGLLARQLDPMALNDMGFEREQPVCAALVRPTDETLADARAHVSAVLGEHARAGTAVRASLGGCACEVARAAELEALLAPCRDEPYRADCTITAEQVEQVRALVEPLEATLASTPVPRVHWRLAGRSDRPGWLVTRLVELLPRHLGGATVFQPGQAIPSRHNHALVRRLLDVPGTVAVLRLDGGRAMLVVRELEGALVLDLVAYPGVDPRMVPLLPFIDDARVDDVVAMLEPPASRWVPPLALDEGNLVHLDRAGLEAVDSLVLAMAPLAGEAKAPAALPRRSTSPLVDAVTLQARFGTRGKELRAWLGLSEAGRVWAQTLGSGPLGADVEVLGLPLEPPARRGLEVSLPLVAHGLPPERLVLDGLERAPALLRTLEMHHPGAVGGHVDAWDVALPAGAVAPGGSVLPALELRAWAERLASEPYRVRASFDAPRHHLDVVLTPD